AGLARPAPAGGHDPPRRLRPRAPGRLVPFAFPLALEVTGRRCVVLGGGAVAEAKVGALLDAGAAVVVIAADAAPGLAEPARRGEIELIGRVYRRGDRAGARLALATGYPS